MALNIAEWVDRVRPHAGVPLIVCESPSAAQSDDTVWLQVFRERAPDRLELRWAGALARLEIDGLVARLRQESPVWLAAIDTLRDPPSKRFRPL